MKLSNINNDRLDINIDNIERIFARDKSKDIRIPIDAMLDTYYTEDDEYKRGFDEDLKELENLGNEIINRYKGQFDYINKGDLFSRLVLGFLTTFNLEFFPIPIYVSIGDRNSIGILIDKNLNPIEIFEGNDEANDNTIITVNKLFNNNENVKIYANHNKDVVMKIRETGYLPVNLYVSPDKEHAEAYWGDDRVLFSGYVNSINLSKESHIDWRVIKDTQIFRMKIY